MVMMKRIRVSVPWSLRCAAAVSVGLVVANGAGAFFFKGWPGDGLPRERTLLPPSTQITTPPEQTEWPPYQPPPYIPQTPEGPTEDNPPGSVPEPATAVLAALGLGVTALARRRMQRTS
jgi:hypothetical protein